MNDIKDKNLKPKVLSSDHKIKASKTATPNGTNGIEKIPKRKKKPLKKSKQKGE